MTKGPYVVNEWGCPHCGGLFVVTDEQARIHARLCAPEDDKDYCELPDCGCTGDRHAM